MVKRFPEKIAALAAAAVAAWLLVVSTRLGPGVGGDATIYITSTRNLLAGNGLGLVNPAGEFRLIPYFPPFYPLMLAFFGLTGIDVSEIAAFLNPLFFALTVAVISLWITEISHFPLAGFLTGLLAAASPVLIPAYSWAMSEPLCILCGTIGLILLERFLAKGRPALLWGSALCCGLAFLTRYSAAAYLGTGAVMLFFFRRETVKNRLRDTFRFLLAAAFPMALWVVYDVVKTAALASRSIQHGWDLPAELTRFAGQLNTILLQWAVPDSWIDQPFYPAIFNRLLVFMMVVLVLGSLAAACVRYFRRKNPQRDSLFARLDAMTLILCGFMLCYTLVILFVSVTTYPPITIGARMFTPAHISFLWLLGILFLRVWLGAENRRGLKAISLAVMIGFAGFYGLRSVRIARQNAIDGLGYHSRRWQESEIVAYLREQTAPDQLLVTNEETALLFLLDRASWPMHEVYVSEPDPVFYAYESGALAADDTGRTAFQNGEALLVVFDTFEDQMRDIYGEDTQRRIDALFKNLKIVIDGDDGTIYSLE